MRVELIAVGSELLSLGRRDTNADWLVERLGGIGVETLARNIVGDDPGSIASAVRCALERADVVLISGGLGPTEDDRTREALAVATGRPLESDPEIVARLREAFRVRGIPFGPEQEKQALRPSGATWVNNPYGTAPGISMQLGERLLFALPGVPAELRAMFDDAVRKALKGGDTPRVRRTLKIGGRTESSVDRQLRHLYEEPYLQATILIGREGIELHLLAAAGGGETALQRVERVEREAIRLLGDDCYGRGDETLPTVVGRLLDEQGATVATAESCTAGLLAGALTETPGSSAWYRGSVVVYDDELKTRLAGVRPDTLARHGAVSAEVALELARGARERCLADHGIGITGIAGPGGGSLEKPVGLVHVALAGASDAEELRLHLIGDRALIRRRSVVAALDRFRRRLQRIRGDSLPQ